MCVVCIVNKIIECVLTVFLFSKRITYKRKERYPSYILQLQHHRHIKKKKNCCYDGCGYCCSPKTLLPHIQEESKHNQSTNMETILIGKSVNIKRTDGKFYNIFLCKSLRNKIFCRQLPICGELWGPLHNL